MQEKDKKEDRKKGGKAHELHDSKKRVGGFRPAFKLDGQPMKEITREGQTLKTGTKPGKSLSLRQRGRMSAGTNGARSHQNQKTRSWGTDPDAAKKPRHKRPVQQPKNKGESGARLQGLKTGTRKALRSA